jgi:hypothetical protein
MAALEMAVKFANLAYQCGTDRIQVNAAGRFQEDRFFGRILFGVLAKYGDLTRPPKDSKDR